MLGSVRGVPGNRHSYRDLDAGPGCFIGGLTTKKYMGITKTSRATGYREITDLLNKKLLIQNPGNGRSVNYDLAWLDFSGTIKK